MFQFTWLEFGALLLKTHWRTVMVVGPFGPALVEVFRRSLRSSNKHETVLENISRQPTHVAFVCWVNTVLRVGMHGKRRGTNKVRGNVWDRNQVATGRAYVVRLWQQRHIRMGPSVPIQSAHGQVHRLQVLQRLWRYDTTQNIITLCLFMVMEQNHTLSFSDSRCAYGAASRITVSFQISHDGGMSVYPFCFRATRAIRRIAPERQSPSCLISISSVRSGNTTFTDSMFHASCGTFHISRTFGTPLQCHSEWPHIECLMFIGHTCPDTAGADA